MTNKDEFGIRVKAGGTTTIGNLSPNAQPGTQVTLSEEQLKMLAQIREDIHNEDDTE